MKKNLLILAALVLLYSGYGAGTAAVAPGKPAVTVKDAESGRNAAEKAVKESIVSHRRAVLTVDLEKMLEFCTGDYQEPAGNGTFRSRGEIERTAKYLAVVRNSKDLEEVMENALLLQNQSLSDARRLQIRKDKESKEAWKSVTMLRSYLLELQKKGEISGKGLEVVNCRISGDKASAEVILRDPADAKSYTVKYFLRRERGRWLVYKIDPAVVK